MVRAREISGAVIEDAGSSGCVARVWYRAPKRSGLAVGGWRFRGRGWRSWSAEAAGCGGRGWLWRAAVAVSLPDLTSRSITSEDGRVWRSWSTVGAAAVVVVGGRGRGRGRQSWSAVAAVAQPEPQPWSVVVVGGRGGGWQSWSAVVVGGRGWRLAVVVSGRSQLLSRGMSMTHADQISMVMSLSGSAG